MSKRLQVVLPDREMAEIQRIARREHLSTGEWVRRALRQARSIRPAAGAGAKLAAIRRGASHAFPAGDIQQMLDEIERGYLS